MTKALPVVLVGQIWRDMDKRMGARRCKVMRIGMNGRGFLCAHMARIGLNGEVIHKIPRTWVRVDRMYPHSTGWMLEQEAFP